MIKKLLCVVALLVGSMFAAQASPVLSVTPSTSNVTVGTSFILDVRISGVSDLFGWQLDLDFGPAGLLNASTPTEGGFLGAGTFFDSGTVNNGAGTITAMFNALSGGAGVSGDGILASISFQAMGVGTATLSLMNVLLIDSNLNDIFFSWPDDALSAVVNITQDGGTQVPEPSTLALLGLALACVLLSRRRALRPAVHSRH
jgi:PEP-CTERM motif/Cohesin domain